MRRAGLSATADTCIDNYQLRSVLGDVIFSLVPQFVVAHVISPAMLQDIIEDDAIKLDWFFKASLVQDLVNVSLSISLVTLNLRFVGLWSYITSYTTTAVTVHIDYKLPNSVLRVSQCVLYKTHSHTGTSSGGDFRVGSTATAAKWRIFIALLK